jgi:hypothetical protein
MATTDMPRTRDLLIVGALCLVFIVLPMALLAP